MKRWRAILPVCLLIACNAISPAPDPAPSPAPSPRPSSTPPSADTGWLAAGDGIETRELSLSFHGRNDRLFIARIDPARVSFQVVYDPARPRRVLEWAEAQSARVAINAGFFDPNYRALGLLIADGQIFGRTYVDLGGLFGVQSGRVQIRSLILQPYRADEAFDQMVQSFPMLLVGDGAINDQIRDDGDRSLRSVAGIDRAGRVVFLVSPRSTFSLTELAGWLAQSDLDLDVALNLDGGTSTGMIVRAGDVWWGLNSWGEVPAVIVAR